MAASAEQVRTIQTGDAGKGGNDIPQGMAAAFYTAQRSIRDQYLQRARRCAGLTIPALFPPPGAQGQDAELPWNSLGAYLVSNLAAKAGQSMFPVGVPPMKLSPNRSSLRDITAIERTHPDQAQKLKTQIDGGLSVVEQQFSDEMEADGDRAKLNVALLKMIVGGNHALGFKPDGTLRGISFERFVVQRDPSGALLRWAIEDPLSWASLPPDVKEIVLRNGYQVDTSAAIQPEICVYTHGQLINGKWRIHQETFSEVVDGTEALLTEAAVPYLFLPWQLLDGEDYGRSYAEAYEADLDLVDGLTKTISQGSAAVARFITMVSPTGLTDKKMVAEADNGAVITGREDDVHTIQSNKSADFQTASNTLTEVVQRLARAFLVTSAVVRQAERVTADEVNKVSQELEEVLGAVYSEQVVTFQTPYVRKKLAALVRLNRVTKLPLSTIDVKVIGGAAALGRNAELARLDQFVGGMEQVLGPQGVLQAINPREYMGRRAAALGIDTANLIPSEEEAAAAQQQQATAATIQSVLPQLVQQMGQNKTANDVAETNQETQLAIKNAQPVTAGA